MITRPFYDWLMSQRQPNHANEIEEFANRAFYDTSFPKQSSDFNEVSTYLEGHVDYLPSMDVFDQAWRLYEQKIWKN